MSRLSQGQHDRLPKYARDELDRLDRENARLLDELQVAQGVEPPGNNTWIGDRPTRGQGAKPLGRSPRIWFETDQGRIEAYLNDGHLNIRGEWSILVAPQSGNAINIVPGRIGG